MTVSFVAIDEISPVIEMVYSTLAKLNATLPKMDIVFLLMEYCATV